MVERLVGVIICIVVGVHADVDIVLGDVSKLHPTGLLLLNDAGRSRAGPVGVELARDRARKKVTKPGRLFFLKNGADQSFGLNGLHDQLKERKKERERRYK